MKTTLIMACYNRSEILKQVLNALWVQKPKADHILFIDDASTDPEVQISLKMFTDRWNEDRSKCRFIRKEVNEGTAKAHNEALSIAFNEYQSDLVIALDSDTIIHDNNWYNNITDFSDKHREVGLISPDKPGCYIRLRRDGYDEVEFTIFSCYAVRREVWEAVTQHSGYCVRVNTDEPVRTVESWYDESLQTSWDCDTCYRIRRLGYRVAVLPGTTVEDLGSNDSTLARNFSCSNFLFNQKWNRILLGRSIYKSRGACLRWEDFPLNVLFRRLVNAQQGTWKVQPATGQLSLHSSDNVSFLACRGNMPTGEELRAFIKADVFIATEQAFEDIDPDLANGKRGFDLARDIPKETDISGQNPKETKETHLSDLQFYQAAQQSKETKETYLKTHPWPIRSMSGSCTDHGDKHDGRASNVGFICLKCGVEL